MHVIHHVHEVFVIPVLSANTQEGVSIRYVCRCMNRDKGKVGLPFPCLGLEVEGLNRSCMARAVKRTTIIIEASLDGFFDLLSISACHNDLPVT